MQRKKKNNRRNILEGQKLSREKRKVSKKTKRGDDKSNICTVVVQVRRV